MKRIILTSAIMLGFIAVQAQENEPDTTRVNLGETEVIFVKTKKAGADGTQPADTLDADTDKKDKKRSHDGHWAGVDFGVTMLMNPSFQTDFPADPQWENDPGKSFIWNLNLFDHKFSLYKHYLGITTGVGFSFTQIGLRNNYQLNDNADSIWVSFPDSLTTYSKNKLRATYVQVPLLLEFNSSDDDHAFYVAAGVVGGIRIGSSVKRKVNEDNFESKEKIKGTYGLNAFKLDALVRVGYENWGLFASYNVLPLFDTDKTSAAYPLSLGLSLNF